MLKISKEKYKYFKQKTLNKQNYNLSYSRTLELLKSYIKI